jgi:hypothetical protein
MASFKAIRVYRHVPEGSKENGCKPQWGQSVPRLRFEPRTSECVSEALPFQLNCSVAIQSAPKLLRNLQTLLNTAAVIPPKPNYTESHLIDSVQEPQRPGNWLCVSPDRLITRDNKIVSEENTASIFRLEMWQVIFKWGKRSSRVFSALTMLQVWRCRLPPTL